MPRSFPPADVQAHSHRLRNEICRLATPVERAQVASHLRNFAVAEVIGFIAILDGHPRIVQRPTLQKAAAAFQQTKGARANPMTHAIPSNLLLNGDHLIRHFHSVEARKALERVFGMGTMAPADWETSGAFEQAPRENNVVDNLTERHRFNDGLVGAFEECGKAAVARGLWDGSGKRRHNLAALTQFIQNIYDSTWVPRARAAYNVARLHLATQLRETDPSMSARTKLLEHRRTILDAQSRVLEREVAISPEAARNVWKFTSGETWK